MKKTALPIANFFINVSITQVIIQSIIVFLALLTTEITMLILI